MPNEQHHYDHDHHRFSQINTG